MATQRMTQTQLVRALAEHGEVNNKVARTILDGFGSYGYRRSKEERRVRAAAGIGRLVRVDRKARTGTQPGNRRIHQDPGKEGREIPRGEGRERRHRSAEEKVTGKTDPEK